ncbi:MAG: secretin and TonB N-terminal domain-containing protein [Candidatus Omnitrophica bacterium]|jgi:type IV pilus assembly protein PilQ|nr:secretin and TonB N-terminal domain-containing protein [Candidatus Omnitrophota bacterium]
MIKRFTLYVSFLTLIFFCFLIKSASLAQDVLAVPEEDKQPAAVEQQAAGAKEITQVPESLIASDNVTLDFKDADINNVLKIISLKAGMNIVSTPDVLGNVTIKLSDVPWERALDVILKTYGYAYEKQRNIILVTKSENISKIQSEEPLRTEVFNLRFLDAQDAEKVIIPLLSVRGKIAILYTKGQKGWQFGTFKIGKEDTSSSGLIREGQASTSQSETISIEKTPAGGVIANKVDLPSSVKSKTLVITDTGAALDKIKIFLEQIDHKPKQVLIETRIMEVNMSKLKDLGFDWGTGSSGASNYTTAPADIYTNANNTMSIAGRNLASEFTPNAFSPVEGVTTLTGKYPYAAGLEVLFKKFGGTQFQVILHALEEDASTNTLSAPRIMTLDNQEASMLVGYHTPILTSTVTGGTTTEGPTQTQSLDYYQEIGIRLNVVPQVSDEGYINMIIHPSVTSSSSSVTATSVAGSGDNKVESPISYPIIDVREAQTQVMMKDGETVVIGGLLKDVKKEETIGIPFISKLPWIGKLFEREITSSSKIDLLIFITAHIVKENEMNAAELAKLEENMSQAPAKIDFKSKQKK